MTHFLNHYLLKYTPLSPIHIGTGDSYEPTNYVIDGDTLYEFDTGGAMAALSANDRAELDKITKGKPDTHMLKAVQTFFYKQREALKPWAINAIPVLDGVAKLYASRVGQAANHEGGGGQVVNKLEIDRTAYNPVTRQPVLYGSSVKGAIRTALLNKANKGERANERQGLHEFQGRLLKYRNPERGKLQLELDPFRLVSISDAAWHSKADLPTSQVFLAVNRKKEPVKDQQGQMRQAMGENLYQILECVPACYARSFIGQLTLQQVGTSHHPSLPAADLRYSAEAIAHACNSFYLPIFTAERKLMLERDYTHAIQHKAITDILRLSQDKIKNGKAFLLRVGRHSGADSITVSGARNGNIKIMKGKGQQPEYADTPKTLWLAAQHKDQRTDLLPFGWLLVEIEADNAETSEWSELAQLCASQQDKALTWVQKQAEQKASLEEKRQVAEQRRERENQERRQQAELIAQAEQEKREKEQAEQQRQIQEQYLRATMSVEQQQIDDLRRQLNQKTQQKRREQIGGILYGDLKNLVSQAADWSKEDKTALQQLGKEILVFINAKDNRKAKELLRSLD